MTVAAGIGREGGQGGLTPELACTGPNAGTNTPSATKQSAQPAASPSLIAQQYRT
jgi:hypothetical protein